VEARRRAGQERAHQKEKDALLSRIGALETRMEQVTSSPTSSSQSTARDLLIRMGRGDVDRDQVLRELALTVDAWSGHLDRQERERAEKSRITQAVEDALLKTDGDVEEAAQMMEELFSGPRLSGGVEKPPRIRRLGQHMVRRLIRKKPDLSKPRPKPSGKKKDPLELDPHLLHELTKSVIGETDVILINLTLPELIEESYRHGGVKFQEYFGKRAHEVYLRKKGYYNYPWVFPEEGRTVFASLLKNAFAKLKLLSKADPWQPRIFANSVNLDFSLNEWLNIDHTRKELGSVMFFWETPLLQLFQRFEALFPADAALPVNWGKYFWVLEVKFGPIDAKTTRYLLDRRFWDQNMLGAVQSVVDMEGIL